MCRLSRWLVNGLCLLSLLACLGAGWLWRYESWGGDPWVEAVVLRTDVLFRYGPHGLRITTIRHWPGRLRALAGGDSEQHDPRCWLLPVSQIDAVLGLSKARGYGYWQDPPVRHVGFAGLGFDSARYYTVYLRADGTPARLTREELSDGVKDDPSWARWSGSLPLYVADGIPPWFPVGFFALPPLLWLALRSHRLRARHRRRQLGLCLRCGYDLWGSSSGKCSECGEARPTWRRNSPVDTGRTRRTRRRWRRSGRGRRVSS